MRRFALALLLAAPAAAQTVIVRLQPPDASGITHTIHAERAASPDARRRGLSGRQALAPDAGMLFEFNPPRPQVCMWMKNTPLPLAALFADDSGRIIKIAFMQPDTTTLHCSDPSTPIHYVLEVSPEIGEATRRGSLLILP